MARTTSQSLIHKIDLLNNPDVGLKYPLNGVTDEDARQFRMEHKLEIENDVFIRGVLAMRHRAIIESRFKDAQTEDKGTVLSFQLNIGDHKYSELEVKALQQYWMRGKRETIKSMSRLHWALITACVWAAITQGWDQAAMAGAAIEIMNAMHKPITATAATDSTSKADENNLPLNENTWLFGLFIGVPFLIGAPIGLIITDRLTEIWRFGRRGAIIMTGLFSFISVIGSASTDRWDVFLGFRVLLGAGMAGKASVVPILLSETSPKNVRGIHVMCWQLFVAFGIAAGSVANISTYRLNTTQSWRYMFISAFIPALVLFSLVLFSPESPRWLLKKSGTKTGAGEKDRDTGDARVRDALTSLIQLHNEPTHILACGELYLLYHRLIEEQEWFGINNSTNSTPRFPRIIHVSWGKRWVLMFREGRMRRANYAAAAVMVSQQLCGINLLAFLADTFFRNSFFHDSSVPNSSDNTALLGFSLAFGLWNFLSTIPTLFFIDHYADRRRLLNWSFPAMALSLLVSALFLLAPAKDFSTGRSEDWVIGCHLTFLVIFITAYSMGEGPLAFVISSEVFPLVNRELGMSVAVFWNFLGAGLLALCAPWLTKRMGHIGVIGLFSGTNLLAWFACYWLVPHTGNEDLEENFKQLDVPTDAAWYYTWAVLGRKVCKFGDYCYHLGHKKWKDCGYGLDLVPLKKMFEDVKGKVKPVNELRKNLWL